MTIEWVLDTKPVSAEEAIEFILKAIADGEDLMDHTGGDCILSPAYVHHIIVGDHNLLGRIVP